MALVFADILLDHRTNETSELSGGRIYSSCQDMRSRGDEVSRTSDFGLAKGASMCYICHTLPRRATVRLRHIHYNLPKLRHE
jgi:hypothetical protein